VLLEFSLALALPLLALFLEPFFFFGLGSPGCRLLAFVLTRLRACLPSFLCLNETLLNQHINLLSLL